MLHISRGSCSALTKHKHHLVSGQCVNHYLVHPTPPVATVSPRRGCSHTPCHDSISPQGLFPDRHRRRLPHRAGRQAHHRLSTADEPRSRFLCTDRQSPHTAGTGWPSQARCLGCRFLRSSSCSGGQGETFSRGDPPASQTPCTAMAQLTRSPFSTSHGIYIKPEGASSAKRTSTHPETQR